MKETATGSANEGANGNANVNSNANMNVSDFRVVLVDAVNECVVEAEYRRSRHGHEQVSQSARARERALGRSSCEQEDWVYAQHEQKSSSAVVHCFAQHPHVLVDYGCRVEALRSQLQNRRKSAKIDQKRKLTSSTHKSQQQLHHLHQWL